MALDIFVWLFAGAVSIFSIFTVYLILAYIQPARLTGARYFIKAKKEGKPLIVLDAGKHFRFIVGEQKIGKEVAQTIRDKGDLVKINHEGLKYSEGGVLMGVAEDFRSLMANISIISLMELIDKKSWTPEEVNKKLAEIYNHLKEDLGVDDALDKLFKKQRAELQSIHDKYKAAAEAIVSGNVMEGIHGEAITEA